MREPLCLLDDLFGVAGSVEVSQRVWVADVHRLCELKALLLDAVTQALHADGVKDEPSRFQMSQYLISEPVNTSAIPRLAP
ncbi:hypothetical protein [Nonomuraea sp. NPDC049784]|uniref:hypothetical protein n=1 Tax=Nonomuraea sp. NPDC049784 TaxID=3154361 RepID=UPI00340D555D